MVIEIVINLPNHGYYTPHIIKPNVLQSDQLTSEQNPSITIRTDQPDQNGRSSDRLRHVNNKL